MANHRQISFANELQELVRKKLQRQTVKELASAAHVSTRTVSTIRDGFHHAELKKALTSNQKRAAWVPIIARLATTFGRPIQEWVEQAGFRWEEVAGLAELEPSATDESVEFHSTAGSVLDSILELQMSGVTKPVKVAVIPYDPFSANLSRGLSSMGREFSFNAIYADRLIGSIDREWQIDLSSNTDIPHLISSLLNDELHMIVGMWATSARSRRGLRFLDIPGWRVPLSGIYVVRKGTAKAMSWPALLNPLVKQDSIIVAVDGPETDYLLGTLRYSREQVVTCSQYDLPMLTELFRKTVREWPSVPVVLVSDEHTCREVLRRLNDSRDRVSQLANTFDVYPRYPLSIAVRDDPKWIELLRGAQQRELFGLSAPMMARLYAAVMAKAIWSMPKTDPKEIHESWKLYDDWKGQGPAGFYDHVAGHLWSMLSTNEKSDAVKSDLRHVAETLFPDRTAEQLSFGK